MADFSAVLRNALTKVDATDPAARQLIYEKARASISRKIESMSAQPPQAVIDAQFAKLDTAITEIEADYVPADLPVDLPVDEDDLSAAVDAEFAPEPVEPPVEEAQTAEAEDIVADETEALVAEPVIAEPASVLSDTTDEIPIVDKDTMDPLDDVVADGPAEQRDPLLDILDDTGAAKDEPSLDSVFADEQQQFEVSADDAVERAIAAVPEVAEKPADMVAPSHSAYDDVPEKAGARWGLLGGLVGMAIVVGGLGYVAYSNQDALTDFFSSTQLDENGVPVRTVPSTTISPDDATGTDAAQASNEAPGSNVEAATDTDAVNKFTQRLTEDGVEVDDGPLDGAPQVGEGSSVSTQSEGLAENGGIQAPDNAQAGTETAAPLPVGQRALFYEERTGSQAGTSFPGAAIWSVVQEEPGVGLAPEPSIRVESSVPDLGLVLEMVIKRNGDTTLPASHIAELFFRVPDTFEGRGIADVQRLTLKAAEGDPGNALIAVPAPIDTNIFLIALNNAETAVTSNTILLREREWIDIPMQYVSGRRALITLEKGSAGRAAFEEVFAYWDANPL